MTLDQALRDAAARGIARLDAQLLLLHALGRDPNDRAWLLAHDTDALATDTVARFGSACERRLNGEPVAYIVGRKEFFGLELAVDARVLVPRPDTETLVAWALDHLAANGTALDLGTGSGAIALALQHARPGATVTAVDRSADALAVARANAERLGLPVRFTQGDWLQGVAGRFDLIVSNPPYIAAHDPHLPGLVHEPLQALVAGTDGLDDLRTIVGSAGAHLHPGGWLLLEHGYDQAEAVRALLAQRGFGKVASRRDLAGIARCSGGQWPIAG
ncbi:peptide chain release factor N(5)-glutamine methyltransferase [Pseudorhodoferax sp. Leaf267]|uniref:peptide chain release factor N(5)-glutamine methyltransferase n=1 Tax=Pseudorhodoferax sp. Leaf267 TaxID=1736316 RepID=UPI0006F53E8F|nr:peptide chain release factor N(5)-glutamine methyltransferase [Pseudorhodoferax sp. Leaf267]KQP17824.1 protein-(glutamine-N5) methyltransferase, release factor-specific [Pseudorhodoferax sp. Leaf267]